MSTSLLRKSDREIAVFKRFIEIANWDIDPDSIEKYEQKNTPDIHFRAIHEGPYAVELVELVNQGEADALGWQGMTTRCLQTAYERLEAARREAFDRKFGHAVLRFVFNGRPSKSRLGPQLHELFEDLLAVPDGMEIEIGSFRSKQISEILASVDVTHGQFNGPIFSVENIGGVGDPITDAIQGKLAKAYAWNTPIDLVAYLDVGAMNPPQIWRGPLHKLTGDLIDLGPFQRIWVVDLRRGSIEYVTPRSGA
jgi:hypothetical protein